MTHATPCFLEFDPDNTLNPEAPYAVLPIPYERTVSYGKGTGNAPAAILAASEQLELFDEELLIPIDTAVQTLQPPDCLTGTQEDVFQRIHETAADVFSNKRFLTALGGEHSISYPLVSAAAEHYPRLTVLHLDAHADLRDSYENNPLSHACVMRRINEIPLDIVHVGIRSLSLEDYELIKEQNKKVFWAKDITVARDSAWINRVLDALGDYVYISLDIDALDPSLIQGTGTPEPGGLAWHDCISLLKAVCYSKNVIAADIVEVIPLPGSVVSEFAAAKIATKIMMYHKHKPELKS